MPNPTVALIGGTVGSSVLSSRAQSSAASSAARAQTASAEAGIAEQRRQFDAIQALLKPWVDTGTTALGSQEALLGLLGAGPQAEAIRGLEQSPAFTSLVQQGEEALLQNASATGGLRGGNLQGALAQFRPQLLAQLIESQFGKLGGLSSIGQSSAAGVGNAGMATGANIANLLQQRGAAVAGGALAQGQAQANMYGGIAGGLGQYYAMQQQPTLTPYGTLPGSQQTAMLNQQMAGF
jgi:hypothetical protein